MSGEERKDEGEGTAVSTSSGGLNGLPVLQRKAYEPVVLPTPEQILAAQFWDSCPVKSVIAGALGGVMGALFGAAFGASDPNASLAVTENQTLRQQMRAAFQPAALRQSLTHLRARSWSYAKGFGGFGMVYSGSECVIESFRAKHDVYNSAAAGCFTGGALAYQAGPKAMCFGCATVAAFSVLIDRFMDIH
ncbi:mitochondrial inner membrane translocase [Chloropicon primus]|uniref:Mitochondrial inner membrane translocase n=1 Tax=Chloropicon primus TaxID=1764295 RepID=A0A5B8MWE3_9CHLO|nr:mitochondrial inner membrane translocase [Chloropicon primus]UPR04344.1 mitochondrial inner membrane translocase [Chloropicon primus]|mmetsp:Transcript_4423/g.13057  ORF Transcript_4423/g.13057 Transcript_4423/m.13057 type:complete len:191 (+) Transcript_4423:173-745(+)|eukprot:QDZ25138.1 mitochondrial inner membrane translocase [Chloropicon primus]